MQRKLVLVEARGGNYPCKLSTMLDIGQHVIKKFLSVNVWYCAWWFLSCLLFVYLLFSWTLPFDLTTDNSRMASDRVNEGVTKEDKWFSPQACCVMHCVRCCTVLLAEFVQSTTLYILCSKTTRVRISLCTPAPRISVCVLLSGRISVTVQVKPCLLNKLATVRLHQYTLRHGTVTKPFSRNTF